jgi:glycyl-tRNA synthetase beta chain
MSADAGRRFLIEVGTEEIPARMVEGAVEALGRGVAEALAKAGMAPAGARVFGTPRRLAALLEGIPARQEDQTVEVTGPPVAAAFDASGAPTRAAAGFARAQGVPVEELRRARTPKGECIAVRRTIPGRSAAEVLAEVVPSVVAGLYFPKTMRWGTGEHRFVRPVHSVVALLDRDVVDMEIAGVRSGRTSFGHRVAGRSSLEIDDASAYVDLLRANGVVADVFERRRTIAAQLDEAARAAGGRIATPPGSAVTGDPDPELLDEVTHLVEWPLVICGSFDEAFLDLPGEILLTSMRHHQKYFALRGANGRLLNRFLSVANVTSDADGAIRRGNEWVLRARLWDARFFYEEDRRASLERAGAALERVAFHEKLGSYADKRARIERLADLLVPRFAASGTAPDPAAVRLAAALCKNDLVTQMVKEFPELEGVVGGLYARADRVPETAAGAIYDHYLPRSLDDPIPSTAEGAVVSLADRLDTQAGIFLLGIVPTGSRDPYALRRSVQGACRILVERGVGLSLRDMLAAAIDGYAGRAIEGAVPPEQALGALLDFWTGRQEYLGIEAGLRADSVRAALAAGADDPHDARLRMKAVDAFRGQAGFDDLAAAHKRIKNILQGQAGTAGFDPALVRDDAERALWSRVDATRPALRQARAGRDHAAALAALAGLREPLDRFFTEVMVLVDDRAVRDNRVALLRDIAALFQGVADVSEIAPRADRDAGPERPGRAAGAQSQTGREA